MEHNFTKHENCHLTSCMICDGGLGLCTVCGCFEGQLATECPGFDVGDEIGDLIWKGIVDFISGNWIFKPRYRDWWTIKIFTIALLFLITMTPVIGECFTSKPTQENWIRSPSDYRKIMSGKIEDPKRLYTITFHNTDAAHTVVYSLYHIDHGFHTLDDIIPVAGELRPLEDISKVREGGLYYVVWREQHSGRVLKSTNGFRLDKHMEFYYP